MFMLFLGTKPKARPQVGTTTIPMLQWCRIQPHRPAHNTGRLGRAGASPWVTPSSLLGKEQSPWMRIPSPWNPPQQVNTTLGICSGHRSPSRRGPGIIEEGFISQIINHMGQGPGCLLWVTKKSGRRKKGRRKKPLVSWVHLLGVTWPPVLCPLPKRGVPGLVHTPPGPTAPHAVPQLISPSRDFKEIG